MEVLGYKRNEFVARDTGVLISGYDVFLAYPINKDTNKDADGHAVIKQYLSDRILDGHSLMIGDNIELTYNRFGKVSGIRIID